MTVSPTIQTSPAGGARRDVATWLHVCHGLDPTRDGGLSPSILGMTGALSALCGQETPSYRGHHRVEIVTTTASRREVLALTHGLVLRGPEADVARAVAGASVVHMHGLWQAQTRVGAAAARRHRVPYLIAAHGMAEPWALRHKGLKKKIYLALIEGKNLRRASCLHALSKSEVGHLRALAPQTPVAFVPNGVDLRPFEDLPPRSALEAEYPHLAGKFLVLFFGRLHVKKGLDLLASALHAVGRDRPDVHLLLAGNDDGALVPFRQQIASLGIADRVTELGYCAGERARRAWGAADAFVLPSYSEGFSMAILEALAARLPVLATTACHFPELATADAGIIVEPTEQGVTQGLRDVLERSPAERRTLGENGRALVEGAYTWDRQAERLAAVYCWLAGGGDPPDAVV